MDEQMGPDLLSDLPLGIIHIILSFLPIIDAVGTSLLSKQWRYIWTGLPNLVFNEECINSLKRNDRDGNRHQDFFLTDLPNPLIPFISGVLLLHKGTIHKFELHLPHIVYDCQCINQWLLFLSRNGIRVLRLEFHYNDALIDAPPSIYSCQNLTHLELYVNIIPAPPPSFKGFLFLRSLDIFSEDVDCSTIESIVAHSPLLEKFTLLCNTASETPMTIRAPNLKYFDLQVTVRLSLWAPLLEEFIGHIPLIKSLEESSVFSHLRLVKLSYSVYDDREVLPMIIHLIKAAPNLQQLEILSYSSWMYYNPELNSVSYWNTESAPHLTYNSLKVIKLENFGGYIDEMKLIGFLLSSSPVLEKMIYKQRDILKLNDLLLQKLTAHLLKFQKASANAEIVVLNERFWNDSRIIDF